MGVFENFKKFLDDRNLYYEVEEENEDYQGLILYQDIKNAGRAMIICNFDRNGLVGSVSIWNIANIDNPSKIDELLRLINNFNRQYAYYSYCVSSEGDVYIKIPIIDAQALNFHSLLSLLQVVFSNIEKNDIGKLMKLQWA